jgi:ElaA protein
MTNQRIVWQCKPFGDLRAVELHRLLQLRGSVFIVEQNCPYIDPDDRDELSLHVMGWQGDTLVACARIIPGGVAYPEVSIGRVATSLLVRGHGIGRELMYQVFQQIENHFGEAAIRISAQTYLEGFYSEYGFKRVGENYLEDDIPHLEMLRKNEIIAG